MNTKQQVVFTLASITAFFTVAFGRTRAGDLEDDHGLIPNATYVATEAASNTARLVDAIELGEPLTCESGGTFWFDDPLPLAPAYRRNNTSYAVGDRVRADLTRIYVCIQAGTTATAIGPSGTAGGRDCRGSGRRRHAAGDLLRGE
jgi:hypothetical protein